MEKGPDNVLRPLNSPDAPAESPGMSHRQRVDAGDVANEIVSPSLNPEEHLLAKEAEAEEQKREIDDSTDSPEG